MGGVERMIWHMLDDVIWRGGTFTVGLIVTERRVISSSDGVVVMVWEKSV